MGTVLSIYHPCFIDCPGVEFVGVELTDMEVLSLKGLPHEDSNVEIILQENTVW